MECHLLLRLCHYSAATFPDVRLSQPLHRLSSHGSFTNARHTRRKVKNTWYLSAQSRLLKATTSEPRTRWELKRLERCWWDADAARDLLDLETAWVGDDRGFIYGLTGCSFLPRLVWYIIYNLPTNTCCCLTEKRRECKALLVETHCAFEHYMWVREWPGG